MALAPFSDLLEAEGLTFGLEPGLLERLRDLSEQGASLDELLDDGELRAAGVGAPHLLRLRRAVLRYRALSESATGLQAPVALRGPLALRAWRWAAKQAPQDEGTRNRLGAALVGLAMATMKQGRLRTHLKDSDDPRSADLIELSGHTEGCADVPPHRWFTIDRAVADGLVWVEVLVPEGETARLPGGPWRADELDRLQRAVAGPVLVAIGARCERQVLAAAAEGLRSVLARPAIQGPVAGVAFDARRLFVAVESGEVRAERIELDRSELSRLCAWLSERDVGAVGVAGLAGGGASGELIRTLAQHDLAVEPIRAAGLMKQARGLPGPLKQAAALVIARRLKDPISGYADLEPDELGLGEYLDRIDPARLKAAMEDARAAARRQRTIDRPTAAGLTRGVNLNPMVRELADVRPGLELTGIVVNLTHFGAFVDLGLEEQGLIHVSELSEDFVQHPSEVVEVGQQVRARVVELDLDRRRIGLSLRVGREDGRRKRSTRSASLKSLDDLFKK